MPTIKICINFTNSTGGQANVNILGPGTNHNYDVLNDNENSFQLQPATYTIKVHGSSGGTLELKVSQAESELLSRSCPPVHLYILDNFTVS